MLDKPKFVMPTDLQHFLSTNASAIFGLIGALGGGILSFIATVIIKKRDFNLQIWGKLFDRRISAHENIISLAVEMRVMVPTGGTNEKGEVRRTPQVLLTQKEFETWFARFCQLTMTGTSWLTVDTKREVNFAQDYLLTLHMHVVSIPSNQYPIVGELIRQDFIDLSSSLEKKAFEFFQKGIHKLKLDSLDEHHKYQKPVTIRRLEATALMRNLELIKRNGLETENNL